jgi:Ca-activated chloride channel family protein
MGMRNEQATGKGWALANRWVKGLLLLLGAGTLFLSACGQTPDRAHAPPSAPEPAGEVLTETEVETQVQIDTGQDVVGDPSEAEVGNASDDATPDMMTVRGTLFSNKAGPSSATRGGSGEMEDLEARMRAMEAKLMARPRVGGSEGPGRLGGDGTVRIGGGLAPRERGEKAVDTVVYFELEPSKAGTNSPSVTGTHHYASSFARPLPERPDEECDEEAPREPRDPAPDNPFLDPRRTPVSTFGVDVDTGSYTLVRRMLREGRLPPKGVVRLEEFINYFCYDYPRPEGEHPFSVTAETATCPWAEAHRVVRIGLKGREIRMEKRPAGNLVFLLDVSGSMRDADSLPLLKRSMRELVEQLDGRDHVSIVAYASEAALVLPPTGGDDPQTILAAIDGLGAGGSTNGAAGIRLAYEQAAKHVAEDGVNRVILATDGDFNVGATRDSELVELIQQRAETGVYLSILGFGTGNYRDATLEQIADRGNGNYAYIDSFDEAKRVLGEAASGTLITIAKDVKLQVEFNPAKVGAYRLLGYENRALKAEDFNDDTKDAGDIGAGHTVTALYEIVPAGVEPPASMERVDELEYQAPAGETPAALRDELLTVKLRYKEPDAETSRLLSLPVVDAPLAWEQASDDFRFAMGVACFGMMLRDSAHKGAGTWALAERLAASGTGADAHGHRAELLELVRAARDRRVIASNPSIE